MAHADGLTQEQLTALKQDMLANPLLADDLHNRAYQAIADYYNMSASDFWVWRPHVSPTEYMGPAGIDIAEIERLSPAHARPVEWLTGGLTRIINAGDPRLREALARAFGPKTRTRAQLFALLKRRGTHAERLFIHGEKTLMTSLQPGTIEQEILVTVYDIAAALQLEEKP
jgi:hypothetical protein